MSRGPLPCPTPRKQGFARLVRRHRLTRSTVLGGAFPEYDLPSARALART